MFSVDRPIRTLYVPVHSDFPAGHWDVHISHFQFSMTCYFVFRHKILLTLLQRVHTNLSEKDYCPYQRLTQLHFCAEDTLNDALKASTRMVSKSGRHLLQLSLWHVTFPCKQLCLNGICVRSVSVILQNMMPKKSDSIYIMDVLFRLNHHLKKYFLRKKKNPACSSVSTCSSTGCSTFNLTPCLYSRESSRRQPR